MEKELLAEIHAFLRLSEMGPSYFGKVSCGNSELIKRLESGCTITLTTVERVRSFMLERSKVAS